MKQFIQGSEQAYRDLENQARKGCVRFQHQEMPPGCLPDHADIGFEVDENQKKYSIYIDNFSDFSKKDEIKALNLIHNVNSPLIRIWRWPDESKSALSVDGDIDALNMSDFLLRFFN